MSNFEEDLVESNKIQKSLQKDIRSFLGDPPIQKNWENVSSILLYELLRFVHQSLEAKIHHSREGYSHDSSHSLNGLKLGYERKVEIPNSDEIYRIESQFVADKNWKIEFESRLSEQVDFLISDTENAGEVETGRDPVKDYLISINDACASVLYNIYPELKNCLEIHVYIFVGFSQRNKPDDGQHFFMAPKIPSEDFTIIYAVNNCPGCWEKIEGGKKKDFNRNKKGPAGSCVTCTLIN